MTAPDSGVRRVMRRGERPFTGARCGGTLLEVLISLVILAMALRMVVQISDRARGAERLARDAQVGTDAAVRWHAARLSLESWSEGERGRFPSAPLNWRLAAVSEQENGEVALDDRWRVLELQRAEEEKPFWSTVVRLDAEQESTGSQ